MSSTYKHTCAFCGRAFPRWYWSNEQLDNGQAGWSKHPALALANFNKHVAACERPLEDDEALPF